MMIFGWDLANKIIMMFLKKLGEVAKFWILNGYTHLDEILYDHSYVGFITPMVVTNALPFNAWKKKIYSLEVPTMKPRTSCRTLCGALTRSQLAYGATKITSIVLFMAAQ